MLPSAGGDFRAEQVAALAAVTHARRTEEEQGERLQKLKDSPLGKEGPGAVQATIRLLHVRFPETVSCSWKDLFRNSRVLQLKPSRPGFAR